MIIRTLMIVLIPILVVLTGLGVLQIINFIATLNMNQKLDSFILPAQNIGQTCETIDDIRRQIAYSNPVTNAFENYILPIPCHPNNGDEIVYGSTKAASFTKGLDHDYLGHVNLNSYSLLVKAIQTGSPQDYDVIPLAPGATRKLVNPQAGNAFTPLCADSRTFVQPIAPTFASAEQAAELVENYWMAITRDIPFSNYSTHPLIAKAINELNSLSGYTGIKPVTPNNLFRQSLIGAIDGPYISQFMYQHVTFGSSWISQQMYPPTAGLNFITTFGEWLRIQKGLPPAGVATFDTTPVYLRNGRDLSHWVHMDVLYQAYFNAALILMDKNIPFKSNLPYVSSSTNQMGFGSFGHPWLFSVLAKLAEPALQIVWFQKWNVHRRMRPEVFAARVHNHKTGAYTYTPAPHQDVLNANATNYIYNMTGTYLLPQAFVEGSPLHPSYGAGHATVAGACVTFLKCVFREDYLLNQTFPISEPDSSGTVLVNYTAGTNALTVGGELNKLASNVAIGRNIAGVHWRSDADQSLMLGEEVAISVLKNIKKNYKEPFSGFTFTSFSGDIINI
jgi:hypothetical protein